MSEDEKLHLSNLKKLKAIEEKYGKKVLIDPKTTWNLQKEEKYLQEIKEIHYKKAKKAEEMIEINGFSLPKRLIRNERRVCARCNTYSFKIIDDIYMIKYDCCYNCYLKYIEK